MRRLLCSLALAACSSSTAAPTSQAPPAPPPKQPAPKPAIVDKESEIITRALVAMNDGTKWGVPTRKFNAGTVTPRQPPAMKKTKTGFEIQFNNHSPVSTPAVFRGRVYSSGGFNSREFYAFDAKTGAGSFGLDLSDDGPSASACEQGTCVFNTESCTVFAVDATTGKARWAWFLGDPQTSSPAIANGRVFTSYPAGATAGDGSQAKARPPNASHVLAAFDLGSGAVVWQDWLDADVISAPVAVGEFLYVATFNGTVIKLEQATGKIRYATKARATSAPVVEIVAGLESMYYTRRADGDAQPATVAGRAHAAPMAKAAASEQIIRTDHNEPQTRYTTPAKKADYLDGDVQDHTVMKQQASGHDAGNGFAGGAPASANAGAAKSQIGQSNVATIQQFQGSRILHMAKQNVNTMGDEVIATNAEDGAQLWSHKLTGNVVKDGGFLGSAPVAAGSHVILATLQGQILELDPKTGKTEHTWEVGGMVRAQPSVVDGWIYVGTEDGRLVAIDTGDATLTGWAMWGGNAARTGMTPGS
jgi:outer membrane protein assembly factor BamB